jgi:hypothetical protein
MLLCIFNNLWPTRAAELLVEEDEEQGDPGSFLCQSIRVTIPVSGEQPVRF